MEKGRELGGFEGRGGKMRREAEPIRSDCHTVGGRSNRWAVEKPSEFNGAPKVCLIDGG